MVDARQYLVRRRMALRRELDIIQAELDEIEQLLPELAAPRVFAVELPPRLPRTRERGKQRSTSATHDILDVLRTAPAAGLTANQVRETLTAAGNTLKASTVSAILSKLKTGGIVDHRAHHFVLRKNKRNGADQHGGKRPGAGRTARSEAANG